MIRGGKAWPPLPVLQLAGLAVLFGPVLAEWSTYCAAGGVHGYALLVPLLAAALAVDAHRRQPVRSGGRSPGAGGALMVLGALMLFAGKFGQVQTVALAGFPMAVLGLVLTSSGAAGLRQYGWALTLLFLMVPLPTPVMTEVTRAMTWVSALVAAGAVNLVGGTAGDGGTLLSLGGEPVRVTSECSGSGTLLVLTSLTVFLAGLCRLSLGRGVGYLLLAPVTTVATNVLRILGTTVVLAWLGRGAVSGPWHQVPGLLMVVVAVAATAGLIVRRSAPREEALA